MKRIYWEVCVLLKNPDPIRGNVELIACKDKRTAIRTANQIKDHKHASNYDYDAIYVQANNGVEILDDCEIRIA
jgi:hypothetical protein